MNAERFRADFFLKAFRAGSPLAAGIMAGILAVLLACSPEDASRSGRIHLTYWEKWTSFEFEAMQEVVNLFNDSQDRIFVELLSTSQIDRKLIIAIAGGNPPDIAGLFSEFVPVLSMMNAMYPLDGYMERHGVSADDFVDTYMRDCMFRGYTWALPTSGAALAFHYNREAFREAGLDPDKPPKTLSELRFLETKLNRVHADRIDQALFLPSEPNWWPYIWPIFFGGRLWNGEDRMTLTSPEVVEAYEWVAGFSERLGVNRVQALRSGFTSANLFASPQNLFLSGRVASVLQGNWMHTFVEKYAPDLEFGVAPMPVANPELYGTTMIESDIVFIPKGAKNLEASFEFIKFVTGQEATEAFNTGLRAISPRKDRSEEFVRDHPNPNIELFERMARSEKVVNLPQIPIWYEVLDEMKAVFDTVWLHEAEPVEILREAEKRLQMRLEYELERWRRVDDYRKAEWDQFVMETARGPSPE